ATGKIRRRFSSSNLDEVLYPIAEKLIEKDALSSEHATANTSANTSTVETTQTKTDKERLEQMLATPIEQMVNVDVLQMIANALGTCIDELDECTTDEERSSTLGHTLDAMVVLGRWSLLQ